MDLADWPLPDNWLAELGRIATLWGCLEALLNHVLGKLAKFDDLGDPTPFIIFSHASFPQRLDIFAALCDQLVQNFPHLGNYPSVVTALRTAQTSRNRFMHHPITFDPDSGQFKMAQGSARGKLKTKVEQISIIDLRRAIIDINEAHRVLYTLVFKREIPPLWERKRPPTI